MPMHFLLVAGSVFLVWQWKCHLGASDYDTLAEDVSRNVTALSGGIMMGRVLYHQLNRNKPI